MKKGGSGEKRNKQERTEGFTYALLFNVSAWVINEYMNGRNCLHLFKGV